MEYEFRRNTLTGTFIANFSMDHEIVGIWFTEELGDNEVLYEQLRNNITLLQAGSITSQRVVGKGISIELDTEQVRVFANVLEMDDELELDESMSFYDGESEAFCGLEDFEAALLSWQAFLAESK